MRDKRSQLLDGTLDMYNSFLDALDDASQEYEERGQGEDLEKLYEVLVRRSENIERHRQFDDEALDELLEVLAAIEKEKDLEAWNELTEELFVSGEYKTELEPFKRMIDTDCATLQKETEQQFEDWMNAFNEGNVRPLALLIEAIDDEYSESADDDCCGRDCGDEDEDDECCGRQEPCCKTSRADGECDDECDGFQYEEGEDDDDDLYGEEDEEDDEDENDGDDD